MATAKPKPGRTRKIPERLYSELIKLSAEGMSTREIVVVFKEQHNIEVSQRYIAQTLSNWKVERSEAAKTAYANSAAQYANQDLNIISDIITKFKTKIDACLLNDDFNQANRLSQTLLNYIKTRLDLSGLNVDKNGVEADEKLKEDLLNRIKQYV